MVVGGRAGAERPWQRRAIWWLGGWGINTTLEFDEVFIRVATVVRERRSRAFFCWNRAPETGGCVRSQ